MDLNGEKGGGTGDSRTGKSWCQQQRGAPSEPLLQDPEEHGGGLGEGDHAVPQHLCRQPGDALLPLAPVPILAAPRPHPAPHAAQHDEEALLAVSAARGLLRAVLIPQSPNQKDGS